MEPKKPGAVREGDGHDNNCCDLFIVSSFQYFNLDMM